jgi:eukaryotic-like serine/threonine-protein kinase
MFAVGAVLNRRYRLDRLVGAGGFARVYLATDLTLGRRVAVKVLQPQQAAALDPAEFLARFAQEARAVAALDHPNILGVHDFGEVGDTAFLVMPFVEGGTLAERLRVGGPLPPASAVGYLRQIAAALDHAHARGLIHRDLKPPNFLLRADDDRLLLADFGIAKALSSASAVALTGLIGTPAYMAPEQFRGQVSRATDIYALGCVLFELLAGTPPFTGQPEQLMYGHVMGEIPSVTTRAHGRVPHAAQAVIARALAKNPDTRFSTAGDLARAFEAAVTGAAPPVDDPAELPQAPARFSRRRMLLVGAPAVLIATLSAGGLVAARALSSSLPATPTPTTALPAAQQLAPTSIATVATIPSATSQAPSASVAPSATSTQTPALTATATTRLPTPTLTPRPPTPTPTPILAEGGPIRGQLVRILGSVQSSVRAVAWSPDGKLLAASTGTGTTAIFLWQADGMPLPPIRGHTDIVESIAWSPDSTMLVSGSFDKTARIWSVDGRELRTLATHGEVVRAVGWSPDGATLASASDDGDLRLWRPDGTLIRTLNVNGSAPSISWSPNSTLFATASYLGWVQIWTREGTPTRLLTGHTSRVTKVAWSPDGTVVASSSADGTVRTWSIVGEELLVLTGHVAGTLSVAWSLDGTAIASGSDDKTARIWGADGRLLGSLTGHNSGVSDVSWSPDGKLLATGSYDTTLRIWR